MPHADDAEFVKYAAKFPAYTEELSGALESFGLQHVTNLTLRLLFVLERRRVTWAGGRSEGPSMVLATRASNELLAFVGSVQLGAHLAAWHHTRALMEICATTHFLFGTKDETPVRLEMWHEFDDASAYCRRRKLELEVLAKKITAEEFRRRNVISDARLEGVDADRIARWRVIYELDLKAKPGSLRHWHGAKSITSMIRELNLDLEDTYDYACHATHVSPIGHRLVHPAGRELLGANLGQMRILVEQTLSLATKLIVELDPLAGQALTPHFENEMAALLRIAAARRLP